MENEEIIDLIASKLTPELLKREYREENASNPMYGHCYVASEVLFHILEASRPNHYQPRIGKDEKGVNHWWIVEKSTGTILDVTASQYLSKGARPPYEKGRNSSFLTKKPSKRAKTVLERMGLLGLIGALPE